MINTTQPQLAYGSDEPQDTGPDLSYGGLPPTAPSLTPEALDARTRRADFALGDKSPGPDTLKDAFQNGMEGQVRQNAAAQADAEFKQDKLAVVSSLQQQGAPLTDKDVSTLVNVGTTPEANPDTVIEQKFSKNFTYAAIAGSPDKNLVFQSAFDKEPEATQQNLKTAINAGSRHHLVKSVLEDAEAAYRDIPWFDQESQKGVVGDTVMGILTGGISSAIIQRNLLNTPRNSSFLPGSNQLEQVQYLYLLPADQIRPALMAAAGPGSQLWKEHPSEAMKFIRAAVSYSASDAYADNVMAIGNVAPLLPWGTALKLFRGGKAIDQAAVTTATKAAQDVLRESPKPPVTAAERGAAAAQDVLSQSPSPAPAGYYAPADVLYKQDLSTKKGGGMIPRQFTVLQDSKGAPILQAEDGGFVDLKRTPEPNHHRIDVLPPSEVQTYTTREGTQEFQTGNTAPPVENGKVRFYHGRSEQANPADYEAWLTPQEDYARNYRGGPNKVDYVDLTPAEAATRGGIDEVNGNRPRNFQADRAMSGRLKPLEGDTSGTKYVSKSDLENLWEVTREDKNYQLLTDEKGRLYVGNRDNGGKRVSGTKLVTPQSEPKRGLYAVKMGEGNDKDVLDFHEITRVDKNVKQNFKIGPKIVADEDFQTRKALADTIKAQAQPDAVDALSLTGNHEAAAEVQAGRIVDNQLQKTGQLGDVESIRRLVPSMASPQRFFQNATSLTRERAQRLADNAVQVSAELGRAIVDPQRVERLTAEAKSRAFESAKQVIKDKFNRNADAILDQVNRWDSASNTYYVESKLGQRDGTLFDTAAQADHYRAFQYQLGKSATVEQEGNKFYLSHIQHIDETGSWTREGLIVSENKTPLPGLVTSFFNVLAGKTLPGGAGVSLRSSRYTTSEFQMNNRVTATHAPSVLKGVIEQAAKDLEALGTWTTNERQELQTILEHNRDFMHPDGKRGLFYNSALEFETAFFDKFGKMPTEKQIAAYDQFVRISDTDAILRMLDLHRDKVRQGIRSYQLPFSKNDASGIPQKGTTDWFSAKKVENFDPVNTQNANIYVLPEQRFTTKFDLKRETIQDLETNQKIKDGKYTILQVYNPGSKPLREVTGIKDNIHFVVVDKYTDRAPILGEGFEYRPGGHVIYQDPYFMKQPQIGTGTLGRLTHFGDTTVKSFATPRDGQAWVDKYNHARDLLRNNDLQSLDAYLRAGNLPETLPEFKKLFTPGGADLSVDHPFVLTTTGRDTFQSSEALRAAYPDLKDTFSSYDLSQIQGNRFLAERDQPLNTIENKGTEANPIYTNVPSRLFDPYTSLQKGMAQIVRQRWMGDYKIQAAESWVQEFGQLFDQSKLPLSKLRQNPVYWLMHAEGNLDVGIARTNPEFYSAAMIARKNIMNFLGARDEVGAVMDGLTYKLLEMTESIGGKKAAQFVEDKLLPGITSVPEYTRKAAFHSVIGILNPVQLFQQAQGLTHVLALSPTNGLKGTTASALARMYRYTEDSAILGSAADKAAALGWDREHFLEAWQAWKTSGVHNIGGETALLSAQADPKLFQSTAGWMLDKGLMFFKAGESIVRDTAYFAAYSDWRAANPTAMLDNKAMGDIGRRFDTLSLNMTRASNAAYNEGILSIPTQFWTWNARFTEQMLGKQLTTAEKARALTLYSAVYGVPATLGGVTFGVIPYMNYQDIRQYALANNYNVSDKWYTAFSEGLPALLTNLVTGHNTDFQRFGPNATQLKDILDGKKSAMEVLGGASGGFLQKTMDAVMPALSYSMSAFKKDSGYPLKWNDLANVAEVVSTFNNGEKAWVALSQGQYIAKNENAVLNKIDTFEGLMLGLGLQPKRASDAYSILATAKDQKSAQEKIGKQMTENWKIAIRAGARGDIQTLTDYMTRVHALAVSANMTKQQEIEVFRRASRDSSDLLDAANKWMLQNNNNIRSYPELQQYFENIQKRR